MMFRYSYIIILWIVTCIVALAIGSRLGIAAWGLSIYEPFSRDLILARDNDFVGSAASFLHTATYNNEKEGVYIGIMRRGPGYATILAGSFLIFGERVWAIYIMNAFFLFMAMFFLWRLSTRFLPSTWAFLPPFLLGVFPGAVAYIWVFNSETWTLFLITGSLWLLLRFTETRRIGWAVVFSVSFGLLVLEKPVLLYAPMLFIIFFAFLAVYRRVSLKQFFSPVLLVLFILFLIVGGWSFRNHRVLGSWQLGDGGHSILRRSSLVWFSNKELVSAVLSFGVGDLIGSRIYPGYPADGHPISWDPRVEQMWYRKFLRDEEVGEGMYQFGDRIISRIELDRELFAEAVKNIRARPVKFLWTSTVGFLRLNAPVNHVGQETMRMFYSSHGRVPVATRITIVAVYRLAWFLFLAVVMHGALRMLSGASFVPLFMVLLVAYFNVMYAMFTHAEVRYILPAMPFYFLLFATGVEALYRKFSQSHEARI